MPLDDYDHVRLAYALTVHKAQGMTAERAFVYLDPVAQDREHSYVEASRARAETRLYAAGESLDELPSAMTRSRTKRLASTLTEGPELVLTLTR